MRSRSLIVLIAVLAAACTGTRPSPQPSAVSSSTPAGTPAIPDGTYVSTISVRDAEGSSNAHVINLATQLAGRYELTLLRGTYTMTLDGRIAVPTPVARRTGGEGAYGRYGFWLFLGVPPIGRGTYSGDPRLIAFRSRRGACFQPGASANLTTGLYRWALSGNDLTLRAVDSGGVTPGSSQFATREGCLGRGFVLTAHPWIRTGT